MAVVWGIGKGSGPFLGFSSSKVIVYAGFAPSKTLPPGTCWIEEERRKDRGFRKSPRENALDYVFLLWPCV